ncbi:MAG: hypothetical protein Q8R49_08700, partial [Rhodoferax sp.]|nr:hypothetical protein [Rhodoferax sp.]
MLAANFDFEDTAIAQTEGNETPPDLPQLRAECLARANLYRILAGVFVEEPSTNFLAALRQPGLLQALGDAGIAFD